MEAPVSANRFLHRLGECKLLPPEQTARIVRRHGLDKILSEADAAQQLVDAGVLTRYQADRLLAGRSRGFFYGPHKVLDALGVGGMSRVLLAEHTQSGQRVALKILNKDRENDVDLVTRLRLEARVGELVRHPHLLEGTRLAEAGGSCYLIMQHVAGIELQELIDAAGPLDVGQACGVICQAAAGLHAAHRAGIVHRDVKPHNLLIDRAGSVKLLDFGLAKLSGESADDEFSLAMIYGHNCLGTVFYMSPEQSLDSDRVDARADVYSLGSTLYHALAGTFPFDEKGRTQSDAISKILQAIRTAPPRPLHDYGRPIPPPVIAIVERMMAKRPEDRFSSAAAAATALAPFAQRQPLQVDVESIIAQRASRARRLLVDSETAPRPSASSSRALGSTSRNGPQRP